MSTIETHDAAVVHVRSRAPPPPPERPVAELRRTCSASELRQRLSQQGDAVRGTKSDLALRLAKRDAFVDAGDVAREFTIAQLRHRVSNSGRMSKPELVQTYLSGL
jgi:hypothetical protein